MAEPKVQHLQANRSEQRGKSNRFLVNIEQLRNVHRELSFLLSVRVRYGVWGRNVHNMQKTLKIMWQTSRRLLTKNRKDLHSHHNTSYHPSQPMQLREMVNFKYKKEAVQYLKSGKRRKLSFNVVLISCNIWKCFRDGEFMVIRVDQELTNFSVLLKRPNQNLSTPRSKDFESASGTCNDEL